MLQYPVSSRGHPATANLPALTPCRSSHKAGVVCRSVARNATEAVPRGLWASTLSCVSGAIVASSLALCPPSFAETLIGAPRVVDGDTLELAGTKIRMYGIDAPEKAQTCKNAASKDYLCGQESLESLSKKIGSKQVACEVKNKDMYGRSVAVCFLEGKEDLNAWMASTGHAVAYKEYSKDYVPAADKAKAARLGIWQGEFQYPADWRKESKSVGTQLAVASASSAPPTPGCNIKGNISAKGEKIYHVPGGKVYDSTIIDTGSGEKWFCSAQEAEAAGWRASKV